MKLFYSRQFVFCSLFKTRLFGCRELLQTTFLSLSLLKGPQTSILLIHCRRSKGFSLKYGGGGRIYFIVAMKQSPTLLERCPVFKEYLLVDIVGIKSFSSLLWLQFRDASCLHLCNTKQACRGYDKLKAVCKRIIDTSAISATKWRSLGPFTLKTNLTRLTCS